MKFINKEKFLYKNKQITEYNLFNFNLIKKEKSAELYKLSLFGLNIFKKKYNLSIKKFYIFGIKFFQKGMSKKTIKLPRKIVFKIEESPEVSIIIPVYNQISYTKQCLYSIWKFGKNVSYELIIADDNSSDATKEIGKFAKNIIIIRNKENLGYIRNCNNAAKFARGNYLYFLNNDTLVTENWLKELLNVFKLKKNVGVVGSKIIQIDGKLQECGSYVFRDAYAQDRGKNPDEEKYSYLKMADYVSGCSMLTPTWLFKKIGGFDEIFIGAYCDDSDYCFSAKALNQDTYVQPKSVIWHFGSISYSETSNKLQEENNKILRKKWGKLFSNKTECDERKLPFTNKVRPTTILVIDDLYPYFDRTAGGKTTFNFLSSLVTLGLNVKFCPFLSEKKDEKYHLILNDMGIEVIPPQKVNNWIKSNIFLDYLFFSRPNVIQHFMTKALIPKDIKLFYYGQDIHHLRMERQFQIEGAPSKEDIKTMKEIEVAAVSMVERAWFPSEIECSYMRNLTNKDNIFYIQPFAYDINKMNFEKNFKETEGIVFVGSSHGPNLDGLIWFVKEVLPIVHSSFPDINLYIVGNGNFQDVLSLYPKNIIIKGPLSEEELSEFYSFMRLTIAPLRYGAGIKGKIIESIYHKTPVVTTQIGVEGIPNTPTVVAEDEPSKMARAIIKLYSDESCWNSMKKFYIPFIKDYFSKEGLCDQFREVFSVTRSNEVK